MRLTPLEDPTLPRGQALIQALAKQLSLLFFSVSQKACFAQLADAALQHGLIMQCLPDGLLAVSFLAPRPPPLCSSPLILAWAKGKLRLLMSFSLTTLNSVVLSFLLSLQHCTQLLPSVNGVTEVLL